MALNELNGVLEPLAWESRFFARPSAIVRLNEDAPALAAMEIAATIAGWHQGETLVVEPNIHELPAKLAGHCTLTALDDALATADVLVLLVDHNEFKATPGDSVQQRYLIDTKGVWR